MNMGNVKLKSAAIFLLLLAFLLSARAASAATIGVPTNYLSMNTGLVGWWTFDGKDMPNGRANDVSGNGNHGSLTNIATSTFYTEGKIGQGLEFDGEDDYVNVPNDSSFKPEGAMTISGWFKGGGKSPSMGGLGTQGGSDTRGYHFGINNGNDVGFGIASNNTTVVSLNVNNLHNNDVWTHYVAVFTPSTSLEIYQNGVSIGQNTTSIPATQYQDNGRAFRIGERGNNDVWFVGSIDDVRVYNRALSATEIKNLYNAGAAKLGVSKTDPNDSLNQGLVGHWTMDGADTVWTSATAATTLDKSGNGNTGTLTNMSRSSSPVSGKIGQGLEFDGGEDYVSVGTTNTYNFSSDFSISAWVKIPSDFSSIDTILNRANGNYLLGSPDLGYTLVSRNISGNMWIAFDIGGSLAESTATWNSSSPPDDQWHHLIAVRNGNTSTIYWDTVSKASNTTDVGDFSVLGQSLYIGATFTTTLETFQGSMDDVRIYNRALSATEIKQLYNLGR